MEQTDLECYSTGNYVRNTYNWLTCLLSLLEEISSSSTQA